VTAEAQATTPLERRSPLGNGPSARPTVVARGEGVEIRERPFLAQVLLRMPPTDQALAAVGTALGVGHSAANRIATSDAGRFAIWLGPDEWLVVDDADPATLEHEIRSIAAPHGGTTTDVSAHRTFLALVGPRVTDVLSAGSSVDWHPRAFAVGHAAQTQLARVDVIVGRVGDHAYIVAVRTSFARYLLTWLQDALED